MERVKGIFHEHKQKINTNLSGKRKQLFSLLEKNDLIKPWQMVKIKKEDDHDSFRSIFEIVENSCNVVQFIKTLRDVDDEIANLVEKPPEAAFGQPLPDKEFAELGGTVVLECELDKKYEAKWLKDKKNVEDDTNVVIRNFNHTGRHSITILKLKGSDIGKYSCICGSVETTCELKVKDHKKQQTPQESDLQGQRGFEILLENRFCRTGERVVLECKLYASFNREPIWIKDGQPVSKNSTSFKRENTPFVKKLTIVKFNQNDEGVYECICGTASTKATMRTSDKAGSQACLKYTESEHSYRKFTEELQNEKLKVALLMSDKQELERQVEKLKNDNVHSKLNKDKLRKAEHQIREMEREIRHKNIHIDDLQKRITTYSQDLDKKAKIIQNRSEDVDKMIKLHEVISSEKKEQDRQFKEVIEGLKTKSDLQRNLEAEKEENAKETKELKKELKKAQEAREKAENDSRIAKEAAKRQASKHKTKQIEEKTRPLAIQRSTAEPKLKAQNRTLPDLPRIKTSKYDKQQNIRFDQEGEKVRQKLERQLIRANYEKQKADDNAKQALKDRRIFEQKKKEEVEQLRTHVERMEEENRKLREEEALRIEEQDNKAKEEALQSKEQTYKCILS